VGVNGGGKENGKKKRKMSEKNHQGGIKKKRGFWTKKRGCQGKGGGPGSLGKLERRVGFEQPHLRPKTANGRCD